MKKRILITIFLLTSVLMFANEHTIVSFNIRHNNYKNSFLDTLNYVVEKNKADVILLQEVSIPKNTSKEEAISQLTNKLKGNWYGYTTCDYVTKECPTTQHNAVLFKTSSFKNVRCLNEHYYMHNPQQNKICPSRYNNVLVIEFHTGHEKFIVVNSHVSPNNTYSPECGNSHTEDFLMLKSFIEKIGTRTPLVLGGDMNFMTNDLRGNICGKKFGPKWFVDGTENEVPNSDPWLTSVAENPLDHFIFNSSFKDKRKMIYSKEFNRYIGMRCALEMSEEKGVEIEKNKYVPPTDSEDGEDYFNLVSDHYPICITIISN